MVDLKLFPDSTGEENLPPAGHERREELKKRTDNLEQEAESKYANAGSIPEHIVQPDHNLQNEIRRSHLDIGVNHPYLIAKWVNYVNQNGSMVWQAKSDGWNVATIAEFPEAADMQKSDGSLRVGDVLLMCIRKDEHLKLEERQKAKRLRQQYGVEAEIHMLAEKTNMKEGRQVFANVQTPEISGGLSDETLTTITDRANRRKVAVATAARAIGNRMKGGTIPGVPIK